MSDRLGRSTPEAQGVASGAIQKFIEAVEASGEELHSLMLLRHGQVIAEGWWSPYRADRPHMLFSLSKSFTSTAIGLAAAEGRLTVDDLVAGYFPDDLPEVVSPNLAALKIRHLLSMSVGHVTDSTESMTAFPKGRWKQGFLAHPVEREPGTHFVYNSGATYMLSAILQKVTGMRLLDYLRPRLLDPIGIGRATWEQSPEKIDTGGWGLRLVTEDIARFGQLYLQNGVWQGKQIVPQAWVREATSWKIDNGPDPNSDWNQGYAYQFWRCRHKSYRGDGAFGQYCVVMPEQDAVLVMTGAMRDMQIPFNCAWDHLLPAMSEKPRRANKTAQTRLTETLTTRALLPPAGAPDSPMADQIDGKTYKLRGNWVGLNSLSFERVGLKALSFEREAEHAGARWVVTFRGQMLGHRSRPKKGEWRIPCGIGVWAESSESAFSMDSGTTASAVWTAEDTLLLTIRLYETPMRLTLPCRFQGDTLTVDGTVIGIFGPPEVRLQGRQVAPKSAG